MLIVSICEHHCLDAYKSIQQALKYPVDAIELRLDYFKDLNIPEIEKIKNSFKVPMIFTLRKKSQGGHFQQAENVRLEWIEKLLSLEPEYFDIEYDVLNDFLNEINRDFKKTKFIGSYHDFQPKNIKSFEVIYQKMQHPLFSTYKIAVMPKSTLDVLAMLDFVNKKRDVAGICMGNLGAIIRVVTPIIGGQLNYCSLRKKEDAVGQIDIDTLFSIYHYQKLNEKTKIYGLIGDPVNHSIGHLFHNNYFNKNQINAVYVKLAIKKEELKSSMKLIRQLPFAGLSVTMPHKETIIPLLDDVDDKANKIGAVNTVVIRKNNLKGFNVDGEGAIKILEKVSSIAGKNIVVFGAGGTAKAIIYKALQYGASVTIVNRTEKKRIKLAKQFQCFDKSINDWNQLKNIDCFINATSIGMKSDDKFPLGLSRLNSNTLVLDVVISKNKQTDLVLQAKKRCRHVFDGRDMFMAQAKIQQILWNKTF